VRLEQLELKGAGIKHAGDNHAGSQHPVDDEHRGDAERLVDQAGDDL
jgi:hypothetical protein